MSKPKWEDAPKWAGFLAMDEDGEWLWHEYRPNSYCGRWESIGKVEIAGKSEVTPWDETKEARP